MRVLLALDLTLRLVCLRSWISLTTTWSALPCAPVSLRIHAVMSSSDRSRCAARVQHPAGSSLKSSPGTPRWCG
eukprot:3520794-Rhodomonas_salina.3